MKIKRINGYFDIYASKRRGKPMKRLILKKLIVLSQSESRSLEVNFSSGLNIILGGNKTGKSSIIKSIFTAFGCECNKVEDSWKQIISSYIISFQYGEDSFLVLREQRHFRFYQIIDKKHVCLVDTDHFHEYSDKLMSVLDIKMPCVNAKTGASFNITPPLLFRFQYIDQDVGWQKIAQPFQRVGYIKDWKGNTNKYVCGYLDNAFYEVKAEKEQHEHKMAEEKEKHHHNQQFISKIMTMIDIEDFHQSPEQTSEELEKLVVKEEGLRQLQFSQKTRLASLENSIFVAKQKLHLAEKSHLETENDIDYAMKQPDILLCPTCGNNYCNDIVAQLDISSDHAMAEKLIHELKEELSALEKVYSEAKAEYLDTSDSVKHLKKCLNEGNRRISYANYYKSTGKQELHASCKEELSLQENSIRDIHVECVTLDGRMKEMKSRKRSKEIRENIEEYCRTVADIISVPKNFIKLTDFVQKLDKSGSDMPKLVYMYQTALYLYNLKRCESPFNFFVVDTPNQQGQDAVNLGKIYSSIKLFLPNDGQVILGTERETGFEDAAATVLELKEIRRCLTAAAFDSHLAFYKGLCEVALQCKSKT